MPLIPPAFQAIPAYPLPTSTPYTQQTALSLIERIETLYSFISEITGIIGERDEAYSKLIDDANKAIQSALDAMNAIVVENKAHELDAEELIQALDTMLVQLTESKASLDESTASLNEANTSLANFKGETDHRLDDLEALDYPYVERNHLFHDVTYYGAIGDGVNDDTSAFNSAIKAAGIGGTVYVPRGTYKLTSSVSLMAHQTLVGEKGSRSALNFPGTKLVFTSPVGIIATDSNTIKSMRIDGLGYGVAESVGIRAIKCSYVTIENVDILAFDIGVNMEGNWYTTIKDTWIKGCGTACIYMTNCYNANLFYVRIDGRRADNTFGSGIISKSKSYFNLFGGAIEHFTWGIEVGNGCMADLNGVYFESASPNSTAVECSAYSLLNIHGSQVYLDNLRSFIHSSDQTITIVNSFGNLFKGGAEAGCMAYRLTGGDTYCELNVWGDRWLDVTNKDDVLYHSGITNGMIRVPKGAKVN